ncbi:hypothetical protein B484DRAFT_321707 [Ochromonadaceae sp. CCMP2298]|nr:hypothetical protein B484DRAFT_321707 [Ochromonadaceae sp. CCMP2298]
MEPPSASTRAFPIVLRDVREFLGPSCDAQLRLVSRLWRDQLATTPVEKLRIRDFLSSVSLISWAWEEINMPQTALVTQLAARGGHLNVLRWLRAQHPPCPWNIMTCYRAAQNGHLDNPPCPWNEDSCASAERDGHLDVLQWLRAQDPPCPWHERSCTYAAGHGHLHVLQWLRAQDPPRPWEGSCAYAAGSGQLHVLQWLRAQDPPCPWAVWTCAAAAQNGHLHVLQWMRAQDPPCPWDETIHVIAAQNGHLHVVQWLRDSGEFDLAGV